MRMGIFTPYEIIHMERYKMSLIIPKHLLTWIDQNRGSKSRQSFILQCMFKIMEVSEMKNN